MDDIEYLKKQHREVFQGLDKMCNDIINNLEPAEREALVWFRRGLKTKNSTEKQSCYIKVHQILGGYILK